MRYVFEAEGDNSTREKWKLGLPQPLWLSLDCLLELGKLSYLIWKRRFRATCWYQNIHHCPTDKYFMIIFWELLGSTKEVTFMRLYFFSYLFKIMISFIKQFKTNYITTYIKENVLQLSLSLYEHQSYTKWDKPRIEPISSRQLPSFLLWFWSFFSFFCCPHVHSSG